MNTRIMFLRNANGSPCGCVAVNIDSHNHKLSYQYSVLNPVDSFNRRVARRLALGGLMEDPIVVTLPRKKDLTMHDISSVVMTVLSKSNAPTRAVKAAKLWLKTNAVVTA